MNTNFKYLQKFFFLLVMGFSLCAVQACSDDEEDGSSKVLENGNVLVSGHEAVDLGLSVKWATCNVGASSPEEYGDYFAWGETTTNWDNSITDDLSITEMQSRGIIDSDGNLTAAYDAATVNWGSKWRMPTGNEIAELFYSCTWTWTTQNGVEGRKVTGPNGNSIFLPAAGYYYLDVTNLRDSGSGHYWSATPYYSSSVNAYSLSFNSDDFGCYNYGSRRDHSVRPVLRRVVER